MVLPTDTELEARYGPTRPLDGALETIQRLNERITRTLFLLDSMILAAPTMKPMLDELAWNLVIDDPIVLKVVVEQ